MLCLIFNTFKDDEVERIAAQLQESPKGHGEAERNSGEAASISNYNS